MLARDIVTAIKWMTHERMTDEKAAARGWKRVRWDAILQVIVQAGIPVRRKPAHTSGGRRRSEVWIQQSDLDALWTASERRPVTTPHPQDLLQ
jgi:hypothetical protein